MLPDEPRIHRRWIYNNPQHRDFVAQGELVFLKIAVNFLLDGITDAVLEEIQSFLALGSDGQVGPVADRLGGDHSGIRQFIDDLLQGQEVRVFLSRIKSLTCAAVRGKVTRFSM